MRIAPPSWPSDFTPRRMQQEAIERIVSHLQNHPDISGLVRAVMGSGKSAVIAAICKAITLAKNEHVVVTTPSRMLVNQLYKTVSHWMPRDVFGPRQVGTFFSGEKAWNTPIIVCCAPSAEKLGGILQEHKRHVVCCIDDEAHGTECERLHRAHEALAADVVIGFTATPFRASDKERLSIFQTLLYNYGPSEAIRDKIVVPWRVIGYHGNQPKLRDDACVDLIRDAQGPGIVNADSIDDAIKYSERLNAEGITAAPLHSKMKTTEHEIALVKLKSGALRTLVHVSMLAQGVDLPWLRWMCLRRPVTSRVRFAQEVGRSLRAFPGKTEAIIYDPHDLFGAFHLEYSAVLGGEIEEKEKPKTDFEFQKIDWAKNVPAVVRTMVEIWLRQLSLAFDVSGISERWVGDSWRHKPASVPQLCAVKNRKAAIAKAPVEYQSGLAFAADHSVELTRGACSDLIGILQGMTATGSWPEIMLPDPLDMTSAQRDRAEKAMGLLEAGT
jgi:hypothetical protein